MLIIWIIIFILSLLILLKSTDWLIVSAERIGLALGLSSFIIGIIIVGIGTSLPELISSVMAVFKQVPEVVAANVIGSNIANILLIVGSSAVIGKKLVIDKDLIDLDLPLLAASTILFLGVSFDKKITLGESILMIFMFIVYLLYSSLHSYGENQEKKSNRLEKNKKNNFYNLNFFLKEISILIFSILALILGAEILIVSLKNLSKLINTATGLIAIVALAVGTSLPELLVSTKAALKGKSDIALGNIFGSNIFNALVVSGVPGLLGTLPIDEKTYYLGIPTMALSTLLFVISGISKTIHIWEGFFYLSIYLLFVAKLFSWF